MCEGLSGKGIVDERIYTQKSNPIRFGGLAINTKRLAEETKEIFDRGNMTTYVLKEKLINQDQICPQNTTIPNVEKKSRRR